MAFVKTLVPLKQQIMENKEEEKEPKSVDLQQHNIENPQTTTKPLYNSTTTERKAEKLPAIENLNHDEGLKDGLKEAKEDTNSSSAPKNDHSLHGDPSKTDLGNGKNNDDNDRHEEIIRT
ncbi:hypothetical protein ACSBL2_10140 [Pedobacter sp. AW31-3R]|uniref:hypothetical protein n=1 Tax=Pedobacter sp. AW31-3R TaxID=3445781 RepID=UPI003F9ED8E1